MDQGITPTSQRSENPGHPVVNRCVDAGDPVARPASPAARPTVSGGVAQYAFDAVCRASLKLGPDEMIGCLAVLV
jgi:hypothetical protein